jgi:hypothetical protein
MSSYLRSSSSIRSLYELKVEKNNGLPVSLSCTRDANSSTKVTASNDTRQVLDSTILFDYELMLRDPMENLVEVLQQDLPKWEFFLLYYVADDIGILGCDIDNQNIIGYDAKTGNATSVDVVSLSSYGTDVVDNRVGKLLRSFRGISSCRKECRLIVLLTLPLHVRIL